LVTYWQLAIEVSLCLSPTARINTVKIFTENIKNEK
jgi:hypothetical protein